MLDLPSILSLFRNGFNKFNNTGTRILDSISHMTYYHIQTTSKSHFWRENIKILLFLRNYNGHHYVTLLNL